MDSIAASYALLDPFMTVTRPIAAVTTAVLAGLGIDRFDKEQPNAHTPERGAAAPQQTTTCSCCSCHGAHTDHPEPKASVSARAFHGLRHAFSEMLADIGGWFLAGVALAGVITVLLPDNALETWLGGRAVAHADRVGRGRALVRMRHGEHAPSPRLWCSKDSLRERRWCFFWPVPRPTPPP